MIIVQIEYENGLSETASVPLDRDIQDLAVYFNAKSVEIIEVRY